MAHLDETKEKNIYNIRVDSTITNSDGEKQEVTLFTEATYKRDAKKAFLMYDETELSGMEGTKTLLTFDGKSVQIKRYGEITSVLTIKLMDTCENLYATPYGTFIMNTYGEHISWNDTSGLNIELFYTLLIEGDNGLPSSVRIKIDLTNTNTNT